MAADYRIRIAPTGFQSLKAIKDKKILHEIAASIDGLARNPSNQGKALVKPLDGIRSLPALRKRYRILFQVDEEGRTVTILLVGRRTAQEETDIYQAAKRLLKTLLGEEE